MADILLMEHFQFHAIMRGLRRVLTFTLTLFAFLQQGKDAADPNLGRIKTAAEGRASSSSAMQEATVISNIPIAHGTFSNGVILHPASPPTPPYSVVRLDVYEDLMCPDCRAFQPVLDQLMDKYRDTPLQVVFHFFPLPYHEHSYSVNQAGMGLSQNPSTDHPNTVALTQWRDAIFAVQESLGNAATANMTKTDVTKILGSIASGAGLSSKVAVDSVWDRGTDLRLRTAIKSAWNKGVTGTPSLFLNDAPLFLSGGDENSSWTVDNLSKVIDPLLGKETPGIVVA